MPKSCFPTKVFFGPQCIKSPCNFTAWPLQKLSSKPGARPGDLIGQRRLSMLLCNVETHQHANMLCQTASVSITGARQQTCVFK